VLSAQLGFVEFRHVARRLQMDYRIDRALVQAARELDAQRVRPPLE
jgi:hypothetical protein